MLTRLISIPTILVQKETILLEQYQLLANENILKLDMFKKYRFLIVDRLFLWVTVYFDLRSRQERLVGSFHSLTVGHLRSRG
jgi:hypothetical protein